MQNRDTVHVLFIGLFYSLNVTYSINSRINIHVHVHVHVFVSMFSLRTAAFSLQLLYAAISTSCCRNKMYLSTTSSKEHHIRYTCTITI